MFQPQQQRPGDASGAGSAGGPAGTGSAAGFSGSGSTGPGAPGGTGGPSGFAGTADALAAVASGLAYLAGADAGSMPGAELAGCPRGPVRAPSVRPGAR